MQFKQPLAACAVGALGLAFSAGAYAQSDAPMDKRFYVAPMISYGFFDNDGVGGTGISQDNSLGGTIAIGKPLTSWLNLELYGFYFKPDTTFAGNDGSTDIYGAGVDALIFPARDTFPVYLVLGAAYGKYNPSQEAIPGQTLGDDADSDYLDAGVGYLYQLNDYGLQLRAEYRYRYTTVDTADLAGPSFEDARFDDHIVSLGLQIPLGAPAQAPDPAPEPAPAPAQPLDSDGDGVIDANDQCPGTPRGTEVDARGCPIEKEAPIVLRGVTFEFDSSRLTDQAESRLDNVVDALEASPDVEFRAEGYTDSIGTEAYNQALSQRRVESVKEYLVNHGISASRMTTVGYGESNPVATNETAAGRAQNRRVELHVTEQ